MRAIAFDAMGVLYRVGDDLAEILVPFALDHGSPLTPDEVGRLYRRAFIGEIDARSLWADLQLTGDATELEADYLRRYELVPGIVDLLDELRAKGIVLGCISNDIAEWSRVRRAMTALDKRITHWTVSGEVGVRKPDSRIYASFLDTVGLPPADVVFVDDRRRNIDAAAQLGFRTILVDLTGRGDDRKAISSVEDLRAALAEL